MGITSDGGQYVFYQGGTSDIYEADYINGKWSTGMDMCTAHNWGCGVASTASPWPRRAR